ncbi:phosphotriesterase-related protein [Halorubrum sp. JWXQ-INN 858]|uniref:phosphotriesterase family protein n=1 Tax=Halorubrum sp. JWXQ-INN 858 TaxID=2690782 RepID=UPI00135A3EC8|nr:TatD family hydrolase [Halorubrum sp. JWXQ-INN 858]MWV63872.1 phosphotriesterase-related protein [Halorubrum sp. JWXQ-INN 858]
MSDDHGTVVTVDGRIDPEDLGVTVPHEHLFADWRDAKYTEPETAVERRLAEQPVTLENLAYVTKHYFSNADNLRLDSVEEAVRELERYVQAGGESFVDVTPKNVGGDPERVRRVARRTGVNVVHGTAYYTQNVHPDGLADRSVADIAAEFASDVRDGIDDTSVRAGIIGEIGLSGTIHDAEERVLRGAARAAAETGAPLTIHPPGAVPDSHGRGESPASRWGLEVLDIAEEEGLSPDRVVIGHMDMSYWYESLDYQRRIAERGAYVEYDIFGQKTYLYKPEHRDAWPSDVQRAERVAELIEDGYGDRVLLSGDVFLKCHRRAYGGFGYAHVLENVVPILRGLDVDRDAIDRLLVDNPRRVLTFDDGA